jgi:hypothetical protein
MQMAIIHAVAAVVSAAFAWIGWWMAHNPGKAYRIMSFGQEPAVGFFVAFARVVGWCFAVAFGGAVILYRILIPIDILPAR